MSNEDEITRWMGRLTTGDESAARHLWQAYYTKLVELARRRLRNSARRVADEEDVALSAFDSFCRGAAVGRFPDLNDRHDLWKLLVTLTIRKSTAQLRREHAQKRGSADVRGESVFGEANGSSDAVGLAAALADEPTPELAAMAAEQCEHLLNQLNDSSLRQIALLKLEGYTNHEIAAQIGCGLRTIDRKLKRIRDCWGEEHPS
jgi:RNA polymerase sigma factor (sigma-70 family)